MVDLRRLKRDAESGRTSAVSTSSRVLKPRVVPRKWAVIAIAGVLAMALIGLGVWWHYQQRTEPPVLRERPLTQLGSSLRYKAQSSLRVLGLDAAAVARMQHCRRTSLRMLLLQPERRFPAPTAFPSSPSEVLNVIWRRKPIVTNDPAEKSLQWLHRFPTSDPTWAWTELVKE